MNLTENQIKKYKKLPIAFRSTANVHVHWEGRGEK